MEMKLTFVNVGYGEAILVECPDPDRAAGTFVLLIDGGGADPEEFASRESGRLPLAEYAAARGLDHIDAAVCTHVHEDHLSGMAPLLERLTPGELWQTLPPEVWLRHLRPAPARPQNLSQRKFLQALEDWRRLQQTLPARGTRVRALERGMELRPCPDLTVRVLSPGRQTLGHLEELVAEAYRQQEEEAFLAALSRLDARMNNFSLILALDYRGTRILLPGDTNVLGYGDTDPAELRADIFKVGHHGQKDGADGALLRTVGAAAVVCCASSDRRYESAHPELMRTIAAGGAAPYFSDCPALPAGLETPPPHQALTFTVGADGAFTARYLSSVPEG